MVQRFSNIVENRHFHKEPIRIFRLSMEDIPQFIYRLIPTGFPSTDDEEIWIFEVEFGNVYYGNFKMAERFLQYVLENCLCTRCVDIIRYVPHLRTCAYPPKTKAEWCSPRNRMCYIPSAKLEEFRKLWYLERVRYRSYVRKSKLGKIPLPPEGILLRLKDKQENRCYYCFNEFKSNSSNLKPPVDHFVSVANGGSNSIFNLVYACGRCNREKFIENGEQFISRKMPVELFPSDIRRNISKMRKSVGEWKEQFKPEYLSHLERLRKEHYRKMPHTRTSEFDKWLAEDYELQLRWECIRGQIH